MAIGRSAVLEAGRCLDARKQERVFVRTAMHWPERGASERVTVEFHLQSRTGIEGTFQDLPSLARYMHVRLNLMRDPSIRVNGPSNH